MVAATRPRTNGTQSKQKYTRAEYSDFSHIGPGTLAGSYLRQEVWHPMVHSDGL